MINDFLNLIYGKYTDKATLILTKKEGREIVFNLLPSNVSLEVSEPPLIHLPSSLWKERVPGYTEVRVHLDGYLEPILDAQVRHITEQHFTQRRIDIVNIDSALKWQPRAKVA